MFWMGSLCDIQNQARILRRFGAPLQDEVVARVLPFLQELAICDPHERIHPVECAGYLCEELGQGIPPFDVREFMEQDEASSIVGPVIRLGGQ